MRVRVRYSHWYPKLIGVNAITLYPYILMSGAEFDEVILKHELVHVRQVRAEGWLRFYLKYLGFYFINIAKASPSPYFDIPYEIEAYKIQDQKLTSEEKEELGMV